jgi:hypothetical protein
MSGAAYVVTGSPTQAFVDALKARLESDATLMAMITGVFGHLSEATRTAYPYLVLGYRHLDEGQARSMSLPGGKTQVQLDGWSDHKGGSEMHAILSRSRVLLDRFPLRVKGYTLMAGSLTCEFEDVFDEPDEDKPQSKLYRGIQRWSAEIDEAA